MRAIVLLTVAAFMLTGCTNDDGDGPTRTTTTTSPPTTTSAPTTTSTQTSTPTDTSTSTSQTQTQPPGRDPVTWDLTVADNSFPGGSITIRTGDTVRWTHTGNNPHSVTSAAAGFDSHPDCNSFADAALGNCMANGETFEFTFTSDGTFAYRCKIHGAMTGTITVEDDFTGVP